MMKMLIVDDEPIICEGLRSTIPWNDYSIKIVGEANDGQEALSKIETLNYDVDIVLTDVVMPVMDGLELSEVLSKTRKMPKIIMISGHDEFAYARNALRVGVKDYLLKPVRVDELLSTIKRLIDEIHYEQENAETAYRLKLKDFINHQISQTPVNNKEFTNMEDLLLFPFISSLKNYYVQTNDSTSAELERLETKWITSIDQICKRNNMNSLSFFTDKNILLTVIYNFEGNIVSQQIAEILLDYDGDSRFHFVMGNHDCQVNEIAHYYQKMSSTLSQAFIEGDQLVYAGTINARTTPFSIEGSKEKIMKALFETNKKEMVEHTNELFDQLQYSKVSLENCVKTCRGIEQNIITKLERFIVPETLALRDLKILNNVPISAVNSYKAIKAIFVEDLMYFLDTLLKEKLNDHNWMIERALSYIEEFFASDIKATEVADYINISPNYFSSLFKKYTGLNFNEYLNRWRINKAKMLLEETSNKVSEIAELVGYQEYKYFVQVFKKNVKLTPTEYRNLVIKSK